jgi:large subunit ribosomal protein L19
METWKGIASNSLGFSSSLEMENFLPKINHKHSINVGDLVKLVVYLELPTKKGNERTQTYSGVVVASRFRESINNVISVRTVFQGIGIEYTFLVNSPMIKSITLGSKLNTRVRRSKLYYF